MHGACVRILKYYKFDEPALNTFDKKEFEGKRVPIDVVDVEVKRLDTILEENKVDCIDFMSIDVEGLEINVLESNDWEKFLPRVILVEQKGESIETIMESEVYQLLSAKGYICIGKTLRTAIYTLKNEKLE